ncbi:MAG: DUF2029 domain-containing protein [Candidatus Thorarchaeota archaeon]|nr:DUF2029 domain-containing protein [Candidatus Thorarchaeota archaeon]
MVTMDITTWKRYPDLIVVLSIVINVVLVIFLRLAGSRMYPFFFLFYIWVAIYAVFLATVLFWQRRNQQPLITGRISIALTLVLLIIVRFIFLGQTETISLDMFWYLDFGKFMLMGKLPYSGFYFPYPPFFAYFIYAISLVAPTIDSFRVLATLADVGVAFLLWKLAVRHANEQWASLVVLAYALLPVSVIESGWNGHFEPLANLFLLLAIWFMLSEKSIMSGMSLGLGTATKIYPGLLFPIILFYFHGWRNRLKFTFSTVITGVITYLPILFLSATEASHESSFAVGGASTTIASFSLPLFLNGVVASITPVTVLIGVSVLIGIVTVYRFSSHPNKTDCTSPYYWTVLLLGITLVLLGLFVGLYPLFPQSRFVFWRYPLDIGVVRGVTTLSVGLVVIGISFKHWWRKSTEPIDHLSLLFLVSATILLLLTLSRNVFYGWYLLWSLPLFFLNKKRTLALTIILCLLLLYPSYTHDNFQSLGYNEPHQWTDDLSSTEGWSIFVNTSASAVNRSQLSASVSTDATELHFGFNASLVKNSTLLQNVSISYTKHVLFSFNDESEFAVRVASAWDPTFGAYAEFSLSFVGMNANNESINGTIVPRTTLFTNLTTVLWRYAFLTENPLEDGGVVQSLTITVYPLQSVSSEYVIDQMYTTYAGPINPLYFLTIPNLVAISLIAYVILRYESDEEQDESVVC